MGQRGRLDGSLSQLLPWLVRVCESKRVVEYQHVTFKLVRATRSLFNQFPQSFWEFGRLFAPVYFADLAT